jgi:glycosyltransferase involved in cell wall biosynthesis
MKLSVVVPVYNEREVLRRSVERVLATPYEKEVIVVDDGSTDGTRDVLRVMEQELPVRVIYQPENRGKGAALRTGMKAATGDVVIIQDADLEYDPRDYPVLLDPIIHGEADVVYGSRFMGGSGRVLYFRHQLGNRLLTLLSNILTDLNLTDMETGYKVFRREVLDCFDLESNRFGFEPEVTAKLARVPRIRVWEVGVSYHGRTYDEGKKIGWKDGAAALFHIARFNLFPGRIDKLPEDRIEAFIPKPDIAPRARSVPPAAPAPARPSPKKQ